MRVRRLCNLLVALSLILCATSMAAWIAAVRGHLISAGNKSTPSDEHWVNLDTCTEIRTEPTDISITYVGPPIICRPYTRPDTLSIYQFSGGAILIARSRLLAVSTSQPAFVRLGTVVYVFTRYWFLAALTSMLPFLRAAGYVIAIRRARALRGRCPSCGYDLRASFERCPECGRPT